jgi:hypothetical protein
VIVRKLFVCISVLFVYIATHNTIMDLARGFAFGVCDLSYYSNMAMIPNSRSTLEDVDGNLPFRIVTFGHEQLLPGPDITFPTGTAEPLGEGTQETPQRR